MTGTHGFPQTIDDLLQRFHTTGQQNILLLVGSHGCVQDLPGSGKEYLKLLSGGTREFQALGLQLLGRFNEIGTVVCDPLEVTDEPQQLSGSIGIGGGDGPGRELHQIAAQNILVMVRQILVLHDRIGHFLRLSGLQGHQAVFQGPDRALCHIGSHGTALV